MIWAVKHFCPYLYGHKCLVITDHEALKSLLNTPHPSGKLARWGLAIQELDLVIQYRPGRNNQSADALSRIPARSQEHVAAKDGEAVVNSLACDGQVGVYQDSDPDLRTIKQFLKNGELPLEDSLARELVLSRAQYEVIDDVLHYVEPDKTLRVVPPADHRKALFNEAHNGLYGAHLHSAKVHGQIVKHYWWPGMRGDIVKPSEDQRNVEVDDYRHETVLRMSAAWEAAQSKIKNA